MRSALRTLKRFLQKEDGATAVECALMLALVIVVCLVAINQIEPSQVSSDPIVIEVPQK